MIDFSMCTLGEISVHQVGNKTNGESLILSKLPVNEKDEKLEELLLQYFLKPFHQPEFFNLIVDNNEPDANPVYNYINNYFENASSFHIQTIHLAKYLFETALHTNIKPGDFYVASFKNVRLDDAFTDMIGIFKAESKDNFIKTERVDSEFELNYDSGINIDKLDKGCLIFKVDKDKGYKVCVVDKLNKSNEALYWRDQFLKIRPCADNYHFTENFLSLTKSFVTNEIKKEYEVSKADQIDLLNKSVAYFKENERFNDHTFSQNVFGGHEGLITSFNDFKQQSSSEYEIELQDGFEISPEAVKKQARVFKSVLKLDKNFHIYIHGDKNMIEKGNDPDGRKFYKIYYTEEN